MSQTVHHRLHILEAADWKDGIITLLDPRSPYRPWRYAFGESRPGDYALVVLGTDPVSVVTRLARIDHEGGLGGAVLNPCGVDLVDLATLAMVLDLSDAFVSWHLDDDDAERVILAIHESPVYGGPENRWGHSSVAAARNLLKFDGDCHGCGVPIDLSEADARDLVHIHTVDPLLRWHPDSPIRSADSAPVRGPFRAAVRAVATDCRPSSVDAAVTGCVTATSGRSSTSSSPRTPIVCSAEGSGPRRSSTACRPTPRHGDRGCTSAAAAPGMRSGGAPCVTTRGGERQRRIVGVPCHSGRLT